jgi:Flp pilus assembly protein TadG
MAMHKHPRLQRRLGRFMGDRSGATAVEFAMVVGPLLFMLFSIIELAMVFLITSTLENATTEASRKVRTGSLQTAGGATATSFRNAICAELGWLQAQCQTNLKVDVRTLTEFSSPSTSDLMNSSGIFQPGNLKFQLGNPGDIVLVRAFYTWNQITPFLPMGGLQVFNETATKKTKQVTAAATFRNEPYS